MEPRRAFVTFAASAASRRFAGAVAALALAPGLLAADQGGAGAGQRAAGQPQAATAASGRVRVPTSHANVHVGPSTGAVLLVMAARGTEFEVTGRDKEWIQVALTPEVRKAGIVVRWYRNETRGWVHDSTVQAVALK